jgi:hypothetical protein
LALKNIPAKIRERLRGSANSNFRSITQEAFARLLLSFDVGAAATAKMHQSWIEQTIASSPAKPARKNNGGRFSDERSGGQGRANGYPSTAV